MQEFLADTQKLFDRVSPEVLNQVAHCWRKFRERAIAILTQPLDPAKKEDDETFQKIPLEFLERGDPMGALWFIETVGRNGNFVDWNVVKEVLYTLLGEKDRMVNYGDEISAETIAMSIGAFCKMATRHPRYKTIPEFHVFLGNIKEMEGDVLGSILHYDLAVGLGSVEGYIAVAQAYKIKGFHEMSVSTLSVGYALTGDIKILALLITALCKVGKIDEAIGKYQELQRLYALRKEKVPPFLVYKGTIENDDELQQLDAILASYTTEEVFTPLESLHTLSISANQYIGEQIQKVSQIIESFDKKDDETSTEEQIKEYIAAIQKRLFYMQIAIISLGNHHYIEYYLREMRAFGILGTVVRRSILESFFAQYFSEDVRQEREIRKPERQTNGDNDEKSSNLGSLMKYTDNSKYTFFESISLHINRIGEIYFHPSFADIQEKMIAPMLKELALLNNDFDEEMDEELSDAMMTLKNQTDYYDGLRPDVRTSYENFIERFDTKYGTFYRRYIQSLVLDTEFKLDGSIVDVLTTYPDIGFFYWLERAISGRFPTEDPEEIEQIVQQYGLDNTNIHDALLFGTVLFDISPVYALGFLADFPNMLDVPQALYIITEGLRRFDPKTRKEAIKDLHMLAKKDYRARGFFEHILYTFNDIDNNNPSDEDIEYMFLTSGNMAILQRKEKEQSLTNFLTAGSVYRSLEGFMQMGDSLEDMGKYDDALYVFEQAFCQEDTIIVVTKILHCSLLAGDYEKTQMYIEHALSKGHDVSGYILALSLWTGKINAAFRQTIAMIRRKTEILDVPEGLLKRLINAAEYALNMEDNLSGESDELKIFASFILQNLILNGEEPDPANILVHWDFIISLCNSYTDDELNRRIEGTLGAFTGELIQISDKGEANDRTLAYIHTHADNCYQSLTGHSQQTQYLLTIRANELKSIEREVTMSEEINKKKEELIAEISQLQEKSQRLFDVTNTLCGTISALLVRFPDAENYLFGWREGMSFYPTTQIQCAGSMITQ